MRKLLYLFVALAVIACLIPMPVAVGAANGGVEDLSLTVVPGEGHLKLDSQLNQLVSAAKRGEASSFARQRDIKTVEDRIRVIVEYEPGKAEAATKAASTLGTVESSYGDWQQVVVPVSRLNALADVAGVQRIRLPWDYVPDVVSEGVPLINADIWQSAGYTGTGVKVAILDSGFTGYSALLGTELPTSVVTQSFQSSSNNNIEGNTVHGTACAEIIHDVAPDAQLYLVNFGTTVELGNAVDWLIAQQVDIISFSMGNPIAGPGNGTGPVGDIVDKVRAASILISSSIGNYAQRHWQGNFISTDGDPWHEFKTSPTRDEGNTISVSQGYTITAAMRWDDPWGASANDYDLYLYDNSGTVVYGSTSVQDGDDYPVEGLSYVATYTGSYYIAVYKRNATRDVNFHLYSYNHNLEYQTASSSFTIPADSPNVMAVGAIPYNNPTVLESFSSQGPTDGGLTKPDLVAPDGVSTASYGASAFYGTSASAPCAAGAAALVLQRYPSYGPAEIQSFLEGRAVDLGTTGKDNVYGSGRLSLGYPKIWVTTLAASNVAADSAVLNGTLDSLGGYDSADVSFEWGTSSGNYTFETTLVSMNTTGAFSSILTGLKVGTVYYFRAEAVGNGTAYGQERSFSAPYLFLFQWGGPGSSDGAFLGPAGICFDTLGNVYIADMYNHRVQKFDKYGNFITKWGSQGSGVSQFGTPWGVAADDSNNIYVTDSSIRIQKFDSNGNFITNWNFYGTGDDQLPALKGIAIDTSGYIYVTDAGNNCVQKLDSNGNFLNKWGSAGTGKGQFLYPYGIAIDASGNVYVADMNNHRIQKFDSNGNFITKWGSLGSSDGQFTRPHGIAVDASSNIYVVETFYDDLSTGNNRIQKFDSNGIFITKWGSYGGGAGQFIQPEGIAVDNSGKVYVSDGWGISRIKVFGYSLLLLVNTVSGTGISETAAFLNGYLVSLGTATTANVSFEWGTTSGNLTHETPLQIMNAAGPFTANLTGLTAGTVYYYRAKAVSDGTAYSQEKSFTTLPGTPMVTTNAASNVTTNTAVLNGSLDSLGNAGSANVSFGWGTTSGNLTHETPSQVMTAHGLFSANLTGLSAGTAYYFRAKATGNGTAYGSEKVFNTTYLFISMWGSQGSGDGQFIFPRDIAVDSAGYVYVADWQNNRIQKFDNNGNFLLKWGSPGSGDGQFNSPYNVTVDTSGNVYVTDISNHRIQKFDANGNFITKWGSQGTGNGQFNYPSGIEVDASGNVYVADKDNSRLQKFDSNGNFITKWGSQGTGNGQFKQPYGVTVDASGNVYVADCYNNRIQKFDSNGNFLTKWGSLGTSDSQLKYPCGVAIDASGNVYVADTSNNRIQKFDSNGNFLTKWGSQGSGNGQFSYPDGVTVDSSGNVYVADTNNGRIQLFGSTISPDVTTGNATSVSANSATLNGNLTNKGTSGNVTLSFEWGLKTNYTATTPPLSTNTTGLFSSTVTGLLSETAYHFRAKSVGDGAGYGLDNTFTTAAGVPPSVTTNNASGIASTSATLNGHLDSLGDYSSANVSFLWGTTSGNLTQATTPRTMTSTGNFTALLTGLSPNAQYYFITKATSGSQTVHGAESSFTTNPMPVWLVTMTAVTATEGSNLNLAFGTNTTATDNLDQNLDVPHPPPGQGARMDAYFEINNPTFPQLDKDFRAPASNIQWTLKVSSTGSENITFTWDVGNIPSELSAFMNTGSSLVDMKTQNSIVLPAENYTITISVSSEVAVQIVLKAGWNMVSLPVTPSDTAVKSVIPSELVVYTWNPATKSYSNVSNFEAGKGYWVAVMSDTIATVTGVSVPSWTVNISAGWNMIGSVTSNVDFSQPEDNPDASVQSFVYWWNPVTKSYLYGMAVEPGKGYWVASIRDCTLTLTAP